MSFRRTKILATLGPSTDGPGALSSLVAAGIDAVRINTAHGTRGEWRRRVEATRRAAHEAGRPIAVVVDLAGPKLRLDAEVEEREVAVGEELDFAGTDAVAGDGVLRVGCAGFADLVQRGRSEIVIGDGAPRFAAGEEPAPALGVVRAVCTGAGRLAPRKGVFVSNTRSSSSVLTDEDLENLAFADEVDAEFVALSFVRGEQDLRRLRGALNAVGSGARVIAKIELIEAVEALDEILEVADGVMVARGDLGVAAGVARLPMLQKAIIHRAVTEGKLAITATQMLESMTTAPVPTRAEATDVANAILDGTSAVMLSGETAVGDHPVTVVEAMDEIAFHAQSEPLFAQEVTSPVESRAEAVMQSAVLLADRVSAAALVVPTTTGGSLRAAAKYRPALPVVGLADTPRVARQLALEWGVIPVFLPDRPRGAEEFVELLVERAAEAARLSAGDVVVVAYGRVSGKTGSSNVVVVREVT